jgi:hypothetical protein
MLLILVLTIGQAVSSTLVWIGFYAGIVPFTTWGSSRLSPRPFCSSLCGPSSGNHLQRD